MNNWFLLLVLLLSACQQFVQSSTDLTRNNHVKPILGCGVQCLTINQDSDYKKSLGRFLKNQDPNEALIVAQCRHKHVSQRFIESVARNIVSHGFRVAKAKPMLPYLSKSNSCMLLVRGPVILYPTRCFMPSRKRGAFIAPKNSPLIGDNFGCYSQQNLSYMIDNPRDLLSLSGFSGKLQ